MGLPLTSTRREKRASFAFGSGILYSVTVPVFGSSLPIKAPVFPVNVAVLILNQAMGTRMGCLEGIFLEL